MGMHQRTVKGQEISRVVDRQALQLMWFYKIIEACDRGLELSLAGLLHQTQFGINVGLFLSLGKRLPLFAIQHTARGLG